MKKLLIVSLMLTLTACGPTPEEIARNNQLDANECMKMGFTPGTENFSLCRMEMSQMREAKNKKENYTYRRIIGSALGAAVNASTY